MTAMQLGMNIAQDEAAHDAKKSEAKAQAKQIARARAFESQERQERLRRVLAGQRARFGAQGMAPGGSSGAVLEGLAAEAEREERASNQLAGSRIDSIENRLSHSRRKNLISASQAYSRYSTAKIFNNASLLDY
jgi:hypothetical protein